MIVRSRPLDHRNKTDLTGMRMKKAPFGLTLLVCMWFPATAGLMAQSPLDDQPVVTGTRAIVNNYVITQGDVMRFAEPLLRRLELEVRSGTLPIDEFNDRYRRIMDEAIENLINRKLVLSEFDRLREESQGQVVFPEKYVDAEINSIIAQDFNNNRADFIRTIGRQGVTLAEYKRTIREDLTVELMISENIPKDITISPQKIRDYYRENTSRFTSSERIRLRMITIRKQTPGSSALISEVKNKLSDGASFTEMAEVYSQDPNRSKGGDYGWIARGSGKLRSDLESVAFSLPVGDPSNIVDTEGEYFIMMVEEKEYAKTAPLEEVRGQIETILLNEEKDRLRELWVNKLKRDAYIKRDL